ncbi:hypothetical protein CGLO_12847 [Colletotrichum gloeosporioides Cg-14]|uniref:Uncharacterized protein n=1 Tax=Colletotrichum gloeosporioides (strain Cg-14) TaxID=1237896 RepID=T0LIM3_COLGC|nr:hypothetical protein CGLO_12847 [Colletotrichum gloeosporioides Cg-14]
MSFKALNKFSDRYWHLLFRSLR